MKPKFLINILLLLATVFSAGSLFAQEFGPEWGANATPEERRQNVLNFNFYKDAYDNKRYDDALKYLPGLIESAPKGAQNIYVYAINIYKNKIQRSRDIKERNNYVDTLLNLYDLRIEHFGDNARYGRGYTLKQKAKDYLLFRSTDREGIREIFNEAIDANAANPDIDFINIYFKELTDDYNSEEIETDFYMESYDRLAAMVESVTDPSAEEAKKTFDAIFISSGAADCDGIEKIYKERLTANPNDLELYNKVFTLLNRQNCESDFFFQVSERYLQLDPSSATALLIAKAYEKQGNLRKSNEYLIAAANNESDPTARATLYVQLSGNELSANNARSAADYAKQASQYDPENGYAYLFLAQAYATGASNCEEFDRLTVYWLAYDTVLRARRIFTGNAEELKRTDELAAQFKSVFPSKEELFFRGLKEGESYDVKCGWVTGRTTVKEGAN